MYACMSLIRLHDILQSEQVQRSPQHRETISRPHTYIHTYIHTYTHTYTHTCVQSEQVQRSAEHRERISRRASRPLIWPAYAKTRAQSEKSSKTNLKNAV